jgi:spore coat polysaccharide biosynthesis protein SpsF
MKIGVVVFTRMSSTRLPGKALIDICGRTLLQRVLERSLAIQVNGPVVVATSVRSDDDALVAAARAEGVEVFRGSVDNVAARGLECAREFGMDAFARVCGDRPFFEPVIVDGLARVVSAGGCDLATNRRLDRNIPGLTAEVLTTQALQRVIESTEKPHDLEHLTNYMYANPSAFAIHVRPSTLTADVSLVVDTDLDLRRARYIAAHLRPDTSAAAIADVIGLAEQWYADPASASCLPA